MQHHNNNHAITKLYFNNIIKYISKVKSYRQIGLFQIVHFTVDTNIIFN